MATKEARNSAPIEPALGTPSRRPTTLAVLGRLRSQYYNRYGQHDRERRLAYAGARAERRDQQPAVDRGEGDTSLRRLLLAAGGLGKGSAAGVRCSRLLQCSAAFLAAGAFASSTGELIAARAGVASGFFITPSTLALIVNVLTNARERAAAIGIWTAIAGVGVAGGKTRADGCSSTSRGARCFW